MKQERDCLVFLLPRRLAQCLPQSRPLKSVATDYPWKQGGERTDNKVVREGFLEEVRCELALEG